MVDSDTVVDSKEGIAALMAFARGGGFVLNETHEAIAKKHGVSTDGVMIARRIPVSKSTSLYTAVFE